MSKQLEKMELNSCRKLIWLLKSDGGKIRRSDCTSWNQSKNDLLCTNPTQAKCYLKAINDQKITSPNQRNGKLQSVEWSKKQENSFNLE